MDGSFARVDVGTADMEERGVISGGHFLGFPVVHDVIGREETRAASSRGGRRAGKDGEWTWKEEFGKSVMGRMI